MKRFALAVAAAMLVPLLGSCRESPGTATETVSAGGQPPDAQEPPTDVERAQALYEQARKSVQDSAFAKALELLEQAHRLDPGSGKILDLYEDVARGMIYRPSEFSLDEWRPDAGSSEQLLRARGELAMMMSRIQQFADQNRWGKVAAELDHAADLARRVLELAASSAKGRLCEAWSSRGLESMQRGDFGAATVFFEIATQEIPGLEFAARSLRAECLARNIAECRAIGSSAEVPAHGQMFPRPPRLRDTTVSAVISVARARFLVGEFDGVREDLRLLATLSPDSTQPRRLSDALSLLNDFDPWDAVTGFAGSRQRDLTGAFSILRSARREESRGAFKVASELFAQFESDLFSFPHSASFLSLQAEASSSAARCRRLAEDASR